MIGVDELRDHDLTKCTSVLSPEVRERLIEYPGSLVLAGGYPRAIVAGEDAADVDLFVAGHDMATSIAEQLASVMKAKIHVSKRTLTVLARPTSVQVAWRWEFDRPADLIASFDFTVAQAAIWSDGSCWRSAVGPRFYEDLARKRLVYLAPEREEEAGDSLLRVLKFARRGYKISLPSLGAVVARLVSRAPGGSPGSSEGDLAAILSRQLRNVNEESSDRQDLAYIVEAVDEIGLRLRGRS